MTPQKIKRVAVWSVIGLVIIAATAYGTTLFFAPTPPLISVSTVDELYQQELAAAQRVCDSVNRMTDGLAADGPIPIEDCLAANRSCEKRWGPHTVWLGATDGDGMNMCLCDDGYVRKNDDGTLTESKINRLLEVIYTPGTCVKQSQL